MGVALIRADGRERTTIRKHLEREQYNIYESISSIMCGRGTVFKQSSKQTALHTELYFVAWKRNCGGHAYNIHRQYGLRVGHSKGTVRGRMQKYAITLAVLSLSDLACNYELEQSIKYAKPRNRGHKSVQSELW